MFSFARIDLITSSMIPLKDGLTCRFLSVRVKIDYTVYSYIDLCFKITFIEAGIEMV